MNIASLPSFQLRQLPAAQLEQEGGPDGEEHASSGRTPSSPIITPVLDLVLSSSVVEPG